MRCYNAGMETNRIFQTRDEINDCKYFFLRAIGEPNDNCLRLIIEEAKEFGTSKGALPSIAATDVRAITSDETCRAYELIWRSYVAYSVRNEGFCALDNDETWDGRLLCLYAESHFLDYIARSTFANDVLPGQIRHWGVKCLNHVVDVASTTEPELRSIANGQPS
jgi:hypothetical protein